MTDRDTFRPVPSRQPMLNVPAVVLGLAAIMAVIEAARSVLSEDANIEILALFAFIPARYDAAADIGLPGGLGAQLWTPVTYALLHGGWAHYAMNVVWLVAFGTPVARRFGTPRFLAFCVVTAIAGAIAHYIAFPGAMVPMVGASAVVSGTMAAAVRFAFTAGGPLAPMGHARAVHRPAVSLLTAFREPRVLVFVGVWVVVNFVFGAIISPPGAEGAEGAEVAWQAHMGGFFAGLLLFSLFDPPLPPENDRFYAH